MKYYKLALHDQSRPVWLIHQQNGRGQRAPVPFYQKLICPKCGKYSYDDVFKSGFGFANLLQTEECDALLTHDGFYCVNEKFRDVVHRHRLPGLDFARIGNSSWYVINVVVRFPVARHVFKAVKGLCDQCGRSREVIGLISEETDFISLPEIEGFFSTVDFREGSAPIDRDVFVTGLIPLTLKGEGLRGGLFKLLVDANTRKAQLKAFEDGKKPRAPKNAFIFLE